jgi:hypothetical protein
MCGARVNSSRPILFSNQDLRLEWSFIVNVLRRRQRV